MKRIAVLTSGGDAPGMNAAYRAVVRVCIYHNLEIFGVYKGYQGLIDDEIVQLDVSSVGDIIHRGGTRLRSARCLAFLEDEGFFKAVANIKKHQIDGLVVIGGDGSFRGAQKLSRAGINAVGIPGTIDNDLAYTDYTIGFDTAVNTVVNAIGNLRDTSTSHGNANIVEVMGRHCGDIALYAGLAGGAETIIIPEVGFDIEDIAYKLKRGLERGKQHNIILVAEGIGHPYEIAGEIEKRVNINTRVTVIGHLQRGGSPTAFDRNLGSRMGYHAVKILTAGASSRVIGMKGNQIFDMDIDEALQQEKEIDGSIYELANILSI